MGSYDSKVLPERKPSITCQHTLSTYPAMRVERPQKARPVASRPPVEVLLHIPMRFSRLESCTLSRHAMLLPAVLPRLLVRPHEALKPAPAFTATLKLSRFFEKVG
jgi:hypothetical protein